MGGGKSAGDAEQPRRNPLLDLPEERRRQAFHLAAEKCPYDNAVRQMLADEGIAGVTANELTEFFSMRSGPSLAAADSSGRRWRRMRW